MIAAFFTVLLAPLFAFAAWLVQPITATCAPGWWLATGVRADGSFLCHLRPAMEQWPPIDAPEMPTLPGRVWCDVPGDVRQDGRRVWCRRGVRS